MIDIGLWWEKNEATWMSKRSISLPPIMRGEDPIPYFVGVCGGLKERWVY